MRDPNRHHEPAGDGSSEDQPRLDPETVQDLEVSEELEIEIKGGEARGGGGTLINCGDSYWCGCTYSVGWC